MLMLLKGREHTGSHSEAGAKMVSQKRKCEGVIEWSRRKQEEMLQARVHGNGGEGVRRFYIEMDVGNLIRRHYLKELFIGWIKGSDGGVGEKKLCVIAFRCAGKEVSLRTML